MSISVQFLLQGFKQTKRNFVNTRSWNGRCQLMSHLNKCTKLSSAAMCQTCPSKPGNEGNKLERPEIMLLKNLLTSNLLDADGKQISKAILPTNHLFPRTLEAMNVTGHTDSKKHILISEDILLCTRYTAKNDKRQKSVSNKAAVDIRRVKPVIWHCANEVHSYQTENRGDYSIRDFCLEFKAKNTQCTEMETSRLGERRTSSGPSPEQLSLVLLRLREELPHFFEGRHRYSIYSEDLLFVNRLTRTTTRSLKTYKFIMRSMQYAGKLVWSSPSLDVIRITKHPEDNTIRLRWTAKGIPWYQMPFFILTGKPNSSLFYRYVDGFSIFEVGRDGLVHCHRLDKVMPTSSPERQKWSLRMQILTLLGLADINRGACEAFQAKNQDMLKRI